MRLSGQVSQFAIRLSIRAHIALFMTVLLIVLGIDGLQQQVEGASSPSQAGLQSGPSGEGNLAVVGAGGTDLLVQPDGDVLHALRAGDSLTAVGRSQDSQWVLVYTNIDAGAQISGWAHVADIVIFGVDQLPVLFGEEAEAANTTTVRINPGTATVQPTPPPTATDTPTPIPTNTATAVPPTPTIIPTFDRQASVLVVTRGLGTELWENPEGTLLRRLFGGMALTGMARSEDGAWLYVQTQDNMTGWAASENIIFTSIDELPIVKVSTLPTHVGPEPSPTPALQSTGLDDILPKSIPQIRPSQLQNPKVSVKNGPTARVTLQDARLNIRSGPETTYAIIGKALPGETFAVVARSGNVKWIQIHFEGSQDGAGWVAAQYLEISIPAINLPISTRTSISPPLQESAIAEVKPSPSSPSTVASPVSTSGNELLGKLVFQSTYGGAIYLYELDSNRLYQLTGGYDPDISPDGRQATFTREGGENGIYIIDIDSQNQRGVNERKIFGERAALRSPKWSPDGAWIVFERADEIVRCRDLGFGLCLTDEELLEQDPNFPVDDYPLVSKPKHKLSRIDPGGNNFRDIAALESARAPDWNKAGIVYQSRAGIQITDDKADSENRLVTFDILKQYYLDPDWQPNGGRILFQRREASHWEIFSVNPDGSDLVALTRPVTALVDALPSNVSPAWSPDGQHIVFLSNRNEAHEADAWGIWVMNADGSEQRRLLIDVPIQYGFAAEQMVSWGP